VTSKPARFAVTKVSLFSQLFAGLFWKSPKNIQLLQIEPIHQLKDELIAHLSKNRIEP